jgi:hypothetical protein
MRNEDRPAKEFALAKFILFSCVNKCAFACHRGRLVSHMNIRFHAVAGALQMLRRRFGVAMVANPHASN